MNVDSSHYKSLDFSDSIWTCKQYNHKIVESALNFIATVVKKKTVRY